MIWVDLELILFCVSSDEAPNGGIITFDKLLKFKYSSPPFSSFSFLESLHLSFLLPYKLLYGVENIGWFASILKSKKPSVDFNHVGRTPFAMLWTRFPESKQKKKRILVINNNQKEVREQLYSQAHSQDMTFSFQIKCVKQIIGIYKEN